MRLILLLIFFVFNCTASIVSNDKVDVFFKTNTNTVCQSDKLDSLKDKNENELLNNTLNKGFYDEHFLLFEHIQLSKSKNINLVERLSENIAKGKIYKIKEREQNVGWLLIKYISSYTFREYEIFECDYDSKITGFTENTLNFVENLWKDNNNDNNNKETGIGNLSIIDFENVKFIGEAKDSKYLIYYPRKFIVEKMPRLNAFKTKEFKSSQDIYLFTLSSGEKIIGEIIEFGGKQYILTAPQLFEYSKVKSQKKY